LCFFPKDPTIPKKTSQQKKVKIWGVLMIQWKKVEEGILQLYTMEIFSIW
jgi:hypothetical protein